MFLLSEKKNLTNSNVLTSEIVWYGLASLCSVVEVTQPLLHGLQVEEIIFVHPLDIMFCLI